MPRREPRTAVVRSRAVRTGRLAALLLGSLLVLPLAFGATALLGAASGAAQLAAVAAVVLACFAVLVVGIRRWVVYQVAFSVTPAGVRQESGGAAGAREVPWNEVRGYVLSDYPNGARMLTIHARHGAKLTVTQGPREEERAAFGAFHAAFLAGAEAHRPAGADGEIRARTSFFDGPLAKVLAGGAVAALAGLVVLVLTSGRPASAGDWMRLAMVAGLLLPFAVRVFAGSPGTAAGQAEAREERRG